MYEVNALATRSSTLLEQIANQYNIPGRYKDYRDLLNQSLDAVFILNRDHAPIIMDAAAANKQISSIRWKWPCSPSSCHRVPVSYCR